jgi:hypothetical protein
MYSVPGQEGPVLKNMTIKLREDSRVYVDGERSVSAWHGD